MKVDYLDLRSRYEASGLTRALVQASNFSFEGRPSSDPKFFGMGNHSLENPTQEFDFSSFNLCATCGVRSSRH